MIVLSQESGCTISPDEAEHGQAPVGSRLASMRSSLLEELELAWGRGEQPQLESYLERLSPLDRDGAVQLIYRHFCLVEAAGGNPDPDSYEQRFAEYGEPLKRLLGLHAECTPSLLDRWISTASCRAELPEVGDSIGPFSLRRELGRGSFARVFLAQQTDLEDRLVVIKISAQATREPLLLARVRHAHIVEIISHATVDDGAFQLICMPFWGGATLAAVLAARPARASRQELGRDLLASLDSVAAPEYRFDSRSPSARDVVRKMTYAQAVAWIIARIAEALDCAFYRGVAHGDVKPSNILLSADANPMMLDFNLARDWLADGFGAKQADAGGTLAYMAPERLRDLAQANQFTSRALLAGESSHEPSGSARQAAGVLKCGGETADQRPHLADIYSLGMVLLEALLGRLPEQLVIRAGGMPSKRPATFKAAAAAAANCRSGSPANWIRPALGAAGYRDSCGLRSILERCLDPNPQARYRRGWELAQDLDRWRTDKPLAFAAEPLLSQVLPRWLRRQRRLLLATGTTLALALCALVVATRWSSAVLQKLPLFKYERHLDDPADYRFRRPTIAEQRVPNEPSPSRASQFDDPREITAAVRVLQDYGVFHSPGWRLRDDVRLLPAADREDLELWLMEQAYRYAHSVIAENSSRALCDRAMMVLDNASGPLSTQPFKALCQQVTSRFEGRAPRATVDLSGPRPLASAAVAAPQWIDEYLLGVAAEYQPEPDLAAGEALDHYQKVLLNRPKSYWGHYRAAAMCFRLGRYTDAVAHLGQCLNRRPENATLLGQRAACISLLNQFDEALREYDQALEVAPDAAFLFQDRARIKAVSGKTDGIAEDLEQFELLAHALPRAFLGRRSSAPGSNLVGKRGVPFLDLPGGRRPGADPAGWQPEEEVRPGAAPVEADELNARLDVARKIRVAGDIELAHAEFSKVLVFDPDHLPARMERALLAIERSRFNEAARDIECVLSHRGLNTYIAEHSDFINGFYWAASAYLNQGKVAEGRSLARRALDLAISADLSRGACHYILARAYAMSSSTNPDMVVEAAKQLQYAFKANREYYRPIYERDNAFASVRTKIDCYLARPR
jgi:serine/threonine protein kinase/tetratricopeptide (TPR) repeat protein